MNQKPKGFWKEFANIEAAILPIASEIGRMPTPNELRSRGMTSVTANIIKTHGGFAAVRERLGLGAVRQAFPHAHWDNIETVVRVLEPVARELGRMPTHKELRERNLIPVSKAALRNPNLLIETRDRLILSGLALEPESKPRPPGYWMDFQNMDDELRPLVAAFGRMPTYSELKARGMLSLLMSISKNFGGIRNVERRMGLAKSERTMPGHWLDFANVERAIRRIADEIGHMPSENDLKRRKISGLADAIRTYHGGMVAVQKKMGFELKRRPNGTLSDFAQFVRELEAVIAKIGHFPTQTELYAVRASSLVSVMPRHGGMAAVRERLGYGPVTDETIVSHADALARIVPALSADPAALWSRMKRSWTARDLDAAVAEYETDGNTERFALLLGG